MRQQNKLLGHVIRSDDLDPMKLPTIDKEISTHLVFSSEGPGSQGFTGTRVKENCKWVYKHVLEKDWPVEPTKEEEAKCIQEIVNAAKENRF